MPIYYALLDEISLVCYAVEEWEEEVDDPCLIRIDFLDTSLVGKVWVPETQTWREATPADISDMKSTKISHGQQWLSDALGVMANLQTDEKGSFVAAINECLNAAEEKAGKSKTIYATLEASKWFGAEAPFTNTFSVEGLTGAANEYVEVSIARNATIEQKQVWSEAGILSGENTPGILTIDAIIEKPLIDIPVMLVVSE